MRSKVFAVLLACSLVCVWVTAVAQASGRIPKGFAYAAEVSVKVTYDGTFTRQTTSPQDCTDNNGNDVKQTIAADSEEKLNRTILFKHITVPVVSAARLGKAATRLALKPTITTPGRVIADASGYHLNGTVVADNSQCPQLIQSYDCTGAISNAAPIKSALVSGGDGFDTEEFAVPIYASQIGDPDTCPGNGETQIVENLDIAASSDDQSWGTVLLHSGLQPHFLALLTEHEVVWHHPITGNKPDCRSGDSGGTCTQSVTGSYRIDIKRLSLYRTKRSYPR